MAREGTVFVCNNCGFESRKWLGRCPVCQEWGSMAQVQESRESADDDAVTHQRLNPGGVQVPTPLADIDDRDLPRMSTGIPEFDRVLGGGLVPGSVVLLAGDPGVGKSTLVLQALHAMAKAGRAVLYVSGEESAAQIKGRARRLGFEDSPVSVLMENDLEAILRHAREASAAVLVLDSIQTMMDPGLDSAPGSLGQVRQVGHRLAAFAKTGGPAVVIIGHVTKEGAVAGPKVLEHMVDAVLYFEGEGSYAFRMVRAYKNRFGSTNEVGVFEMTGNGMEAVENPSGCFLSHRPMQAAGSSVIAAMAGNRPILLEVQALLAATPFSAPRRTTIGLEPQRVAMLLAVMAKHGGIDSGGLDVYVNVAGGFKVRDPATDLGICAAIASSFINRPVPDDLVLVGEVGLAGEVRGAPFMGQRLAEAARLGFTRALAPSTGVKADDPGLKGMTIRPITSVASLTKDLFRP